MMRIRYREDGVAHSLVLIGHANYDNAGKDIVCAGASAIVYALLGWLENNEDDLEYINADVHDGNVQVACAGGDRTAAAFEMTIIGLEQLAEAYPDHVQINTGAAG